MARGLLAPVLLFALVLIGFSRLYSADFTAIDDTGTIAYNPKFAPPTAQTLRALWTEPAGGLYIPVTYTLWWILVSIGPPASDSGPVSDPAIFHVANVVLHSLSTLVVFAILRRHFSHRIWASFVGAAVFAMHPLQTEAVGWISGCKDVLCGLFSLLAIYGYLSAVSLPKSAPGVEAPDDDARVLRQPGYWLGMLAFAIAMLCKPTAMVTPALVLSLDLVMRRSRLTTALRAAWPWFVLALPCIIWTKHFQDRVYRPGVPIWGRPLIALDSFAYYMTKVVLPFNLTMDPGRRPDWIWNAGVPFFSWLLPVAVAVVIFRYRKRYPWLMAAGAAMAIPILPVSGLVPFAYQAFSTVTGHYMYLPMFGVAIAVAGAVAHLKSQVSRAAILIVLILLTLRTMVETGYWHDNYTLLGRMVEVNPRSYFANDLLGRMLYHENHYDAAVFRYREAVRLDPTFAPASRNLGDLLIRIGNATLDPRKIEEGVESLARAMDLRAQQQPDLRPEDSPARVVLGRIFVSLGRSQDARGQFERVILENTEPASVRDAKREIEKLDNGSPSTTRATSAPPTTSTVPTL